MYNPIPCTTERLFPTRWICRQSPTRDQVAAHLLGLRAEFGAATARECKSRMMWVGIFPTQFSKSLPN